MTIIGIDPHPSQHTAVALDTTGQALEVRSFPNSQEGLEAFLEWLTSFPPARLAIEGPTHPFFASWLAYLLAQGFPTFPIPTQDVSHLRRRQARGKADPQDAVLVARVLLSNPDLPPLSLPEWLRPLQELSRTRQALAEDLKAHRMRLQATREPLVKEALSRVVEALEAEVARLGKELSRRVKEIAPRLLKSLGIGPVIAGIILAETGDIGRFADQGHFASYCGAAPLPWQSGAGEQVRVNFGGNRRLNYALHLIALTRLRLDPRTRAFWGRKLAEGKTKREALRVLKTYLAREVYRTLKAVFAPSPKLVGAPA